MKQGRSHFFYELLTKISAESGDFKVEELSDKHVFILKFKDGTLINLIGGHLGLNSDTSTLIASDKVATAKLLTHYHTPAVQHELISSQRVYPGNTQNLFKTIEDAFKVADSYNGKPAIVVKPNDGYCGREVELATSAEQATEIANRELEHNNAIAISPFVAAEAEYRCTYLNGKIRLVFKKERTEDWRFNLHAGSTSVPMDETSPELKPIIKLAEDAGKAIGITFANIDIFKKGDELQVLEINSAVTAALFVDQHPEYSAKIQTIFEDAIHLLKSRH